MRDKSHDEQIERWAKYVREHPNDWKKYINAFLDAQIIKANNFYKQLAKTEEGKEKIKVLLKYPKNRKIN